MTDTPGQQATQINAENPDSGQLLKAAVLAGNWWAERLNSAHAGKREAFALAVAIRIDKALRGVCSWNWNDRIDHEEPFKPRERVETEVDYDPRGLLLEAVREVIDPACRGCMFSADGILPRKHALGVTRTTLSPKEGYGNWTSDIEVPQ